MYIAFDCLDFFRKGEFSVHKNKKECPEGMKIVRVSKPCYLEVKFGHHEQIGTFSRQVHKIKENKIDVYKWGASFCNAPDDSSSEYEDDGDDGYRFITFDNLGLPFYCRTIHITKEILNQKKEATA